MTPFLIISLFVILALLGTPLFAVIGALGFYLFYLVDIDISALII